MSSAIIYIGLVYAVSVAFLAAAALDHQYEEPTSAKEKARAALFVLFAPLTILWYVGVLIYFWYQDKFGGE